jgi:hypothetical protein
VELVACARTAAGHNAAQSAANQSERLIRLIANFLVLTETDVVFAWMNTALTMQGRRIAARESVSKTCRAYVESRLPATKHNNPYRSIELLEADKSLRALARAKVTHTEKSPSGSRPDCH